VSAPDKEMELEMGNMTTIPVQLKATKANPTKKTTKMMLQTKAKHLKLLTLQHRWHAPGKG
jgi:hypothetical protein